jgi:hypothetical protein
MSKETNPWRDEIEAFSHQIVQEVAPKELPLFDGLLEEYYEDPTPPDTSQVDREDPLAFGPGISMAMVTPAAAAMVSAVLSFIAMEVLKGVKEELGDKIQEKTKEILNDILDKKEEKTTPEITQEQFKDLYKVAVEVAREYGMKEKQAKKMAKAFLGEAIMAT